MHRWRLVSFVGCLVLASACAGPIGTTRVDPKVVQADLGRSAITTGEPSWPTRNVLFERGLFDAFAAEPEAALAALHRAMVAAQGLPRRISEYRAGLAAPAPTHVPVAKMRDPRPAAVTPYNPGLIPAVFMHGTASSPVRWAEIDSRLQTGP